ncbi:hypothetical protein ACTFIU_005432 [Dictyostelium citrinum]
MITCYIQLTNNYTLKNINIKNCEMVFINVTTNGKSGGSKVFKYLIQSDEVHQYSAARNIFQNLFLSILIINKLPMVDQQQHNTNSTTRASYLQRHTATIKSTGDIIR